MNFSQAAKTYRENAVVQKFMAENLCYAIDRNFGKNFKRILEIGSGTGFLSEKIAADFSFSELFLNDLTDNFTGIKNAVFIKGDALKVQLPEHCSLIASNACFQWIEDIESFLNKLKTCLNPDGVLAFSSFGKQNYKEFKQLDNFGLKYVDYLSILDACNYEVIEYEEDISTMYFSSPREVLRHIKTTGVALKNNEKWSKGRLKTFEQKYRELFSDINGVTLTYHPLYILARPR